MKRFTGHTEEWGTFLDVKVCKKPINLKRLANKNVFLSSVTDCYNMYEEKYRVTRDIIEQLMDADCSVGISTKSKLILRDMDLLKRLKDLKVSMSINTLDEEFRKDMDYASSIADRIATLKELHNQGIYTVLFMSPIFPYITDFTSIIEATNEFVEEYWFENLNLRGSYKKVILDYIFEKYQEYAPAYQAIYVNGQKDYWEALALEIEDYCREKGIKHRNYFYHEKLVKEKIEKNKFS
jgi:DNA repair photolyase